MQKRLRWTGWAAAVVFGAVARPGPAVMLSRSGSTLLVDGQPARLIAYGDYGFVAEQAFDYAQFLDAMNAKGINFVRIWCNYHWCNDLTPFAGDRVNKYDLLTQNGTFYARLRNFVAYADTRGIVVQVCLFDGVALIDDAEGLRWDNFPYNNVNNLQSYLTSPSQYDDVGTEWWNLVNVPLIDRVVEELGDYGNVMYEVCNEPDSHGVSDAFNQAVVDRLYERLQLPQYTGSKVICVNAGSTSLQSYALSSPKVDVIARHINDPSQANDYNNLTKPVIVSNDGDASCYTAAFGGLPEPDRIARTVTILNNTFGSGAAFGHNHFEFLDKGINGSSWRTTDYNPRASNTNMGIVDTLVPYLAESALCNTGQPVQIDLGTTDAVNCLILLTNSDGDTSPADIGGRNCRSNTNPGGSPPDNYMYFGVNDSYAYQGSRPYLQITIEYYDTGTGSLVLEYDSSDTAPFPGNIYKAGGSIVLTGSNTWKQHTYHVTDAYFGNRQNVGADFRIAKVGGGFFYLDIVQVAEETGPRPPVAVVSASPVTGPPPLTVNFDGSASYDTDGTIAAYAWDFDNNGTTDATGATAGQVYAAEGTYVAKLTVTDNSGLADSEVVQIVVSVTTGSAFAPITAISPSGTFAGSAVVNTLTVQGFATPFGGLVGPPDVNSVEIIGGSSGINVGKARNLSTPSDVRTSMVGLQMGYSALGLSEAGERVRGYFPQTIYPDGTSKPEIFILEWAKTTDTFQVQLLGNGPGQAIVIVGTVQILATDFAGTSTQIDATSVGLQPVGGVAVNLDGIPGVCGVRGVQLPAEDGLGGITGLDPAVIAASPVYAPLQITTAPESQTKCPGESAVFAVAAVGRGQLAYQWQKDGTNIDGATGFSYTIGSVTAANAGSYRCVVTGACGSVESAAATLTVRAATAITQQPANQQVAPGATAVFTVAATGDGSPSYRWRKNGVDLFDGGNISGAATAQLQVVGVGPGDVAGYRCVATAGCGIAVSNEAALTLARAPADFDLDGDVDLADFSAFQACFNGPNQAAAAGCTGNADFDDDNDVDLSDFATFTSCFNGPNRPPACD